MTDIPIESDFQIHPIGVVRSPIKDKGQSPIQGRPHMLPAKIEIFPQYLQALTGLENCNHIFLLLWLHLADRSMLQSYPKNDKANPLRGIFSIRSASRPNPIGLHLVDLLSLDENILTVKGLEAIDNTPVVDIKPHKVDLDMPG